MEALESLLRPLWITEKWIIEAWDTLQIEEKTTLKSRLNALFKDGLPMEIRHDKTLYVYVFALLAQLKTLEIQLSLRLDEQLPKPAFRRAQLLDEIFHALVLTKIAFLLCKPYGFPPDPSKKLDAFCHFIRSQDCIRIAVLINLVCKGVLNEVFRMLHRHNIAAKVFEIILADTQRHTGETESNVEFSQAKERQPLVDTLRKLEELLTTLFFVEPHYAAAISVLLGLRGTAALILTIHEQYVRQLKKINLTPSKKWDGFFHTASVLYTEFEPYIEIDLEGHDIDMSARKKLLLKCLNEPGDPTMVAQFNLDLSELSFFEKKYSSDMLTVLMLQTVSRAISTHDPLRQFLSHKKLYQGSGSYVALVERLPGCGDHTGTIYFKDCHKISFHELTDNISRALQLMTYCYKKREQLEKAYPELNCSLGDLTNTVHEFYPFPLPGSSCIYLSNVGPYGYTQIKLPLPKSTGLVVALLAVEQKPVWNESTQAFIPKTYLPISVSADMRVFDGTLSIPELLQEAFHQVLEAATDQINVQAHDANYFRNKLVSMADGLLAKASLRLREQLVSRFVNKNETFFLKQLQKILGEQEIYGEKINAESDIKQIADHLISDYFIFNAEEAAHNANFNNIVDKMLAEDLEVGYQILLCLQMNWFDYMNMDVVFDAASKKIGKSRLNKLSKFISALVKAERDQNV